jgi:hypothetical protein
MLLSGEDFNMAPVNTVEYANSNNRIGSLKTGYVIEYPQSQRSNSGGKVNTNPLIVIQIMGRLVTGFMLNVKNDPVTAKNPGKVTDDAD